MLEGYDVTSVQQVDGSYQSTPNRYPTFRCRLRSRAPCLCPVVGVRTSIAHLVSAPASLDERPVRAALAVFSAGEMSPVVANTPLQSSWSEKYRLTRRTGTDS